MKSSAAAPAWVTPACAALLLLGACSRGAPPPSPPATAAAEAASEAAPLGTEVPILALGDSLFAGYGLGPGESYPARLEAALRARGIAARVANAGVSGDTTAAGRERLAFTLAAQPRAPVLVLVCLGGNDMLRGLPPADAKANLDAILAELDRRRIPAVLMGMLAPPNLGAAYAREFDAIYPALATRHHAALVPFFLQATLGKPALVQPDHLHPTAPGVDAIVAATVDTVAGAVKRAPPRRGEGDHA